MDIGICLSVVACLENRRGLFIFVFLRGCELRRMALSQVRSTPFVRMLKWKSVVCCFFHEGEQVCYVSGRLFEKVTLNGEFSAIIDQMDYLHYLRNIFISFQFIAVDHLSILHCKRQNIVKTQTNISLRDMRG